MSQPTRNLTLLTDLYQLTMMNGYLKQDKKGQGDKVDFIVINNDLKGEIKSIELKELYNLL
jgi:nicotinic acid phosphoribosyltransferase